MLLDQNGFRCGLCRCFKTFRHVPGTSIYQHEDICGALKALQDNPLATGSGVKANKQVTGIIEFWQSLIKPENLVTVLRLEGDAPRNAIDTKVGHTQASTK